MHHRIDTILKGLRQDLARRIAPESIARACQAVGHRWRRCHLDPVAIVHWFVTQILLGNTALTHVARLGGGRFTDSANAQARARLPLAVFQKILRDLIDALGPTTNAEGLWRGHRTWLVDGSSFSMPDTPDLQNRFGQSGAQRPGCGFPVAKILALFHAGTGLLMDIVATPLRSHDMASVAVVHPSLMSGDVLVADRGFCSFAHLALLVRGRIHAVFRIHQRQIVDFTPHRSSSRDDDGLTTGRPRSRWLRGLGVLDQVVEYVKPESRPEWMTAEEFASLPGTLVVRELRYQVGRPGFRTRAVTLVTTLLDPDLYPLEALAELYGTRWRVELYLRHVKTTMKMDVLKCKTVEGVLKEMTVYAIVYNLVRVVMIEASRRQAVATERISFVDALRWLIEAKPGEELAKLVVNPDRPGHYKPRVRKRRPKAYPLMTEPRSVLRNRLLTQAVST